MILGKTWKLFISGVIFFLLAPTYTLGHGDEKHDDKEKDPPTPISQEAKAKEDLVLVQINAAYVRSIKPIFQKKCFDCHTKFTKFPWYFKIPGPKHLMEYDIRTARKHIEMSNDFPFGGHGSPMKDLQSLKESTEKNDMPPLRYKMLHWDTRLTDEEKEKVLQWVDTSIRALQEK